MQQNSIPNRLIDTAEIEKLYAFTDKHFVPYYDLQTELVDHLANAIEAQWVINPNLSFEDALALEFKKFGVFGFTTIVEERQAALSKYYWGKIFREFATFFRFPKIVLMLIMTGVLYRTLLLSSYNNYIILALFGIMGIIEITAGYQWYRKIRHQQKVTEKKWLLHDIIRNIYIMVPVMLLANSMNFLFKMAVNGTYGHWQIVIFTIIMVPLGFLEYVRIVKMPALIDQEMARIVKNHQFVK